MLNFAQLKFLLTGLTLLTVLAACSDDNTSTEAPPATIEIAELSPEADNVSFRLIPTNAISMAYKIEIEGVEFDTVTELKQVRLTENFRLPIYYGTSTDCAYETRIFTYSEQEAKERATLHLNTVLQSLTEKGVQISANHVKIGIQNGICTAKGTVSVIEEAGQQIPVQIPEQPTERNTDLNE